MHQKSVIRFLNHSPRRHEGEEAVEYGDDEEEHHDDDHQGVSFGVNDFIWQVSDRKGDVLSMTLKQNSQESKSQNHGFFSKSFCLGSSRIMLLLLGRALECAINARRCPIATMKKDVLTTRFSMSFSIVFATFLSRVVFFCYFSFVFFSRPFLDPSFVTPKKRKKPSSF